MTKDSDVCPYCKTGVTETAEPKYVNGIKATTGDGCEFCNPSEDFDTGNPGASL